MDKKYISYRLISLQRNFLWLCIIVIGSFFPQLSFAQISFVSPNISPANLVQNVLLGSGVTVSNVTYNNSAYGASTVQNPVQKFTNSSAVFPMNEGVMLLTDNAASISDPDLQAITTNTVTNGVILEFDFIPEGDTLSFSYIFTSAEYNSFTCSAYNDVFGFFISGPGISGPYSNGAINIATVPGGNVPVGINTVNSGSDPSPTNCYAADPNWQANAVYFTTSYNTVYNSSTPFNNMFPNFNGSTVKMSANASLICGETYHIKLAISNVGDQSYDSGVFLQAGSFSSIPSVSIDISNIASTFLDSVLVENCSTQGEICFSRPANHSSDSLIVYFDLSGTATQGVDFNQIAQGDSIIFVPGETEKCYPIVPVDDGIDEGLEQLIITTFSINPCGDTLFSSGSAWITDEPILPTPDAGADTVVCNSMDGWLNGTFSVTTNELEWTYSGPGTITFTPGDNVIDPDINASIAGTYQFKIKESNDTCSVYGIDSVIVIFEDLDIQLSQDTTICQNGSRTLVANATGGDNFVYHWDNANTNSSQQIVSPTDTTVYNVYAVSDNNCHTDTLSTIVNLYPPIALIVSPNQTICPFDSTEISVVASGGIGIPYSFEWNDLAGNIIGNTTSLFVQPSDTTTYMITVKDACETSPVTGQTIVNVAPIPEISISAVDPTLCTPANFTLLNLGNSNQLDSMWWFISDGQVHSGIDNINPQINAAGVYSVGTIIKTKAGCYDTAYFDNFLEVYPLPHPAFTYYPNPATVLNSNVHFQNYTTGATSYIWDFEGEGVEKSYSSETNPVIKYPDDRTGIYKVTLTAISEFQCVDSTFMLVEVKPDVSIFVPNAFTPDGDKFNQIWKPILNGVNIYDVTIVVYNRWGELIFESHDLNYGWDGTYGTGKNAGKTVQPGTYVWKIRAKDGITDQKYTWNGIVTVLY